MYRSFLHNAMQSLAIFNDQKHETWSKTLGPDRLCLLQKITGKIVECRQSGH